MNKDYKDILKKKFEEFDWEETPQRKKLLRFEVFNILKELRTPDSNDLHIWGLTYFMSDDDKEYHLNLALEKFLEAFELDSKNFMACLYIAHCYHDKVELESALKYYELVDKEDPIIFIPSQIARERLSIKLGLEFDGGMQDWEWEISDSGRITDFLNEYDKSETTSDEKRSLMEILLDGMNDLLLESQIAEFEKHFSSIQKRLSADEELHLGTWNYWTKNNFEISTRLIKSKTGCNTRLH